MDYWVGDSYDGDLFGWENGISGERDAMESLGLSVFGGFPLRSTPFRLAPIKSFARRFIYLLLLLLIQNLSFFQRYHGQG